MIDYKQTVTKFVEAQKVINVKLGHMQELAIKQFEIMHDLETEMGFESDRGSESEHIYMFWEPIEEWKFEVREYTKFLDRLFCIGINDFQEEVCSFWLDADIINQDTDTFRRKYSESLEALRKKQEASQKNAVKKRMLNV